MDDIFSLFIVVSIILPIVIEAIKKAFGEEKIKDIFYKMEIFCFFISFFIGIFVIFVYLLFSNYISKFTTLIDVIKVICLIFGFGCMSSIGSQIGYDKLIKTIKEIFTILNDVGNL